MFLVDTRYKQTLAGQSGIEPHRLCMNSCTTVHYVSEYCIPQDQPDLTVCANVAFMLAGKWQDGKPKWVESLQRPHVSHELANSHAEAVDLCMEAARMARDAGVEGALRSEQHWLPQGTMQVWPSLTMPHVTVP